MFFCWWELFGNKFIEKLNSVITISANLIVIFGGHFTPKCRSPPFLFSKNPNRELKKGGTHNG